LAQPVDGWNRLSTRYRFELLLASFVFILVLALSLGVGALWVRDDSIPSVRILGAGSGLSVLVMSGDGRLLIASGDDASAFGNALANARHPTNRRLDAVILAGGETDVAVAKRARRDLGAAQVFLIDGPLTAHLDDLELDREHVVTRPMLLRLPGGVDVTVAPDSPGDGKWSSVIQRGNTRIFAGNDVGAIDLTDALAAVVVTDKSAKDLILAGADAAIVMSSRSITARELRDAIATGGRARYAMRVEPADVVTLTFVSGGLKLPGSVTQYGGGP
jgi:hypothetical protein